MIAVNISVGSVDSGIFVSANLLQLLHFNRFPRVDERKTRWCQGAKPFSDLGGVGGYWPRSNFFVLTIYYLMEGRRFDPGSFYNPTRLCM